MYDRNFETSIEYDIHTSAIGADINNNYAIIALIEKKSYMSSYLIKSLENKKHYCLKVYELCALLKGTSGVGTVFEGESERFYYRIDGFDDVLFDKNATRI